MKDNCYANSYQSVEVHTAEETVQVVMSLFVLLCCVGLQLLVCTSHVKVIRRQFIRMPDADE